MGDEGMGGAASPAPLLCYNMDVVAYGKCGNYHFECCCFLKIVIKNKGKARNSKTSFEKNCFSAWASTLNMGLINKVDMVCLSPVGYGV